MSRRLNVAALVVAVIVCLSAWVQGPQASQPQGPVVVTQAEASLKRAPDQAWVLIGAETRAPKPADAQRLNAAAMSAMQTAVKSAGIAADAIKTTSYSLQPDMEYVAGSSRVKGYIARNQIEVRVDALDKLGDLLDLVGTSGGTSIAGLRFDVKDRETLEREALRAAVKNAMARAEAMALGAGRQLGPIVRVEEDASAPSGPMPMMSLRTAATPPPPTPIAPGEIDIKARVTLTVALR